MSEKINVDLKSLKFIFDRNKFYILPVVILLSCIVLFSQFIIPQFETLLMVREEAKEASLKLETLKESLNILVNTSEDSLDSQLKILNLALPLNKDFEGILNSIYYASQKTGVKLGSFSVQIGDLSEAKNNEKFSTISISLPIDAGVAAVNSFVEIINNTVPLSEVSVIKIGDKTSTINLSFYYKPLGSSKSSEDIRINPISKKGLSLINKLTGFDNISYSFPKLPGATSSGY